MKLVIGPMPQPDQSQPNHFPFAQRPMISLSLFVPQITLVRFGLALILSMFDVSSGQWPVASVHSPNVHLLWLQIVFVVKLGYNMAKTV